MVVKLLPARTPLPSLPDDEIVLEWRDENGTVHIITRQMSERYFEPWVQLYRKQERDNGSREPD